MVPSRSAAEVVDEDESDELVELVILRAMGSCSSTFSVPGEKRLGLASSSALEMILSEASMVGEESERRRRVLEQGATSSFFSCCAANPGLLRTVRAKDGLGDEEAR